MIERTWIGAWVVAAVALLPSDAAGQAEAVRGLERALARDVAEDSLGALTAAVFRGDRILWQGAFGRAEPGNGRRATPETVFRAGSVTKIVTGLLLLRLVGDGVVALDDPAVVWVPELARIDPEGRITLRDLAAHTSGLAREPRRAGYGRGPYGEWRRKVRKAVAETRVEAPGSYRYSNIGYGVLGLALERAAEAPFEALVRTRVLEPLGMGSTGFVLEGDHRRRLATGWVNHPGERPDPRVPRAEHGGRGYRVPGEGLYSTAGDLARLGMALTGAIPLLPDSLREILITGRGPSAVPAPGSGAAAGDPAGGLGAGYGLGVRVLELGGLRLIGHGGTVPGYVAYLLVDPVSGAGVVLLRSYNFGETNLAAKATEVVLDLREEP